jgi:hypothetical protein
MAGRDTVFIVFLFLVYFNVGLIDAGGLVESVIKLSVVKISK